MDGGAFHIFIGKTNETIKFLYCALIVVSALKRSEKNVDFSFKL